MEQVIFKQSILCHFVKRSWDEQTGGGCMVSFVELENGHVLGIDNDSICLYGNEDQFHDGIDGDFNIFPMIDRTCFEQKLNKKKADLLADEVLNDMVASIQDRIGQKDGGFAGMHFEGEKWDSLVGLISEYIQKELTNLDNERD